MAEPGFGFVTVTATLPACELAAVPAAVNFVAETNVVWSAVEPKFTVAPLTKPLPNAVMVNEPIPSCDGEIEES